MCALVCSSLSVLTPLLSDVPLLSEFIPSLFDQEGTICILRFALLGDENKRF